MLKIRNVKTIRYRGYALYSTSETACITCKINKHKFIPLPTIDSAKQTIDLLIDGDMSETDYALCDFDTMLEEFKWNNKNESKDQ